MNNIYASEGKYKYEQIGQGVDVVDGVRCSGTFYAAASDGIQDEGDYGCREGYANVLLEFVCELTPLSLGRHNRGVGDKRQVVAKETAAYDDSHHHSRLGIGLLGYARGNRDEGSNGTAARAYAERHYT